MKRKMNINGKINFILTFLLIGLILGTKVGMYGLSLVLKLFKAAGENVMFFLFPAVLAVTAAIIYMAAVKPIKDESKPLCVFKSILCIACAALITLVCFTAWVVLSFSAGMRFFY